jgi:hypothetical protein
MASGSAESLSAGSGFDCAAVCAGASPGACAKDSGAIINHANKSASEQQNPLSGRSGFMKMNFNFNIMKSN